MFVFFFVPGCHLSGFRKLTFQVSEFVLVFNSTVILYCYLVFVIGSQLWSLDLCSSLPQCKIIRPIYYLSLFCCLLWPPCIQDANIIFSSLFFLSSFFLLFSSPNLSGRRLDVYHTSTQCGLSANLECRSEMCCTRLAR